MKVLKAPDSVKEEDADSVICDAPVMELDPRTRYGQQLKEQRSSLLPAFQEALAEVKVELVVMDSYTTGSLCQPLLQAWTTLGVHLHTYFSSEVTMAVCGYAAVHHALTGTLDITMDEVEAYRQYISTQDPNEKPGKGDWLTTNQVRVLARKLRPHKVHVLSKDEMEVRIMERVIEFHQSQKKTHFYQKMIVNTDAMQASGFHWVHVCLHGFKAAHPQYPLLSKDCPSRAVRVWTRHACCAREHLYKLRMHMHMLDWVMLEVQSYQPNAASDLSDPSDPSEHCDLSDPSDPSELSSSAILLELFHKHVQSPALDDHQTMTKQYYAMLADRVETKEKDNFTMEEMKQNVYSLYHGQTACIQVSEERKMLNDLCMRIHQNLPSKWYITDCAKGDWIVCLLI